jgi:hypothetical protein
VEDGVAGALVAVARAAEVDLVGVAGAGADALGVEVPIGPREDTDSSCGWWWPHKDFVVVSDRPCILERDARGRLHGETGPAIALRSAEATTSTDGSKVTAQLTVGGEPRTVYGEGGGPISAFVQALADDLGLHLDVLDYSEHAVSAGADATAAAYVEVKAPDGSVRWGVGLDESILTASLKAVVSAANRIGATDD